MPVCIFATIYYVILLYFKNELTLTPHLTGITAFMVCIAYIHFVCFAVMWRPCALMSTDFKVNCCTYNKRQWTKNVENFTGVKNLMSYHFDIIIENSKLLQSPCWNKMAALLKRKWNKNLTHKKFGLKRYLHSKFKLNQSSWL